MKTVNVENIENRIAWINSTIKNDSLTKYMLPIQLKELRFERDCLCKLLELMENKPVPVNSLKLPSEEELDPGEVLPPLRRHDFMNGARFTLAEVQRLNATAQPVSDDHARIANALDSLLWPNMASGNKAVILSAINALRGMPAAPELS